MLSWWAYWIQNLEMEMKTIIAGSRRLETDQEKVWLVADAVMKSGWRKKISEVVSGAARGIDLAALDWAASVNIPVQVFVPDWDKHGKAAGPIRNSEMANYGEALILIWDGKSRGSASMKKESQKRNIKIYEYIVT